MKIKTFSLFFLFLSFIFLISSTTVYASEDQELQQTSTKIENNQVTSISNNNENNNNNVNDNHTLVEVVSSPEVVTSSETIPQVVTTPIFYEATPQVVYTQSYDTSELPRTGIPLAAWALGGLLPASLGLKKFLSKASPTETANTIWINKQLNS